MVMPMMDNLDEKIFAILSKDGRASNAEMARALGVSEGTVRRRVTRLIDEEAIHTVAVINPQATGYECEVIIGIDPAVERVHEIAEELSTYSEVDRVAVVTGRYAIFAWATLRTHAELERFLSEKVHSIPGINSVTTSLCLEVTKRWGGTAS